MNDLYSDRMNQSQQNKTHAFKKGKQTTRTIVAYVILCSFKFIYCLQTFEFI